MDLNNESNDCDQLYPCENFTMVVEEIQYDSVSNIHRFSPAKRFSSQNVECCNTFYGLSTMLSDTSTTMKAGSCNEKAYILLKRLICVSD